MVKPFLPRHSIEVGRVPQLAGLFGESGDELGMRVTERVDGDARSEIEIALAGGGGEPAALAALKNHILARVGSHHRRLWRRRNSISLRMRPLGRRALGHEFQPSTGGTKKAALGRPMKRRDTRAAPSCQRTYPGTKPVDDLHVRARIARFSGSGRIILWRMRHGSLSTPLFGRTRPLRKKTRCSTFFKSANEMSRQSRTIV